MTLEMIQDYIKAGGTGYTYLMEGEVDVEWKGIELKGSIVHVDIRTQHYYDDTIEIPIMALLAFVYSKTKGL